MVEELDIVCSLLDRGERKIQLKAPKLLDGGLPKEGDLGLLRIRQGVCSASRRLRKFYRECEKETDSLKKSVSFLLSVLCGMLGSASP